MEFDMETFNTLKAEALTSAREIPDLEVRFRRLSGLADTGEYDFRASVLGEAVETARGIGDHAAKSRALDEAAFKLTRLGGRAALPLEVDIPAVDD